MDIGARTDVGRVRGNNEDSFKFVPELNLFILSDGMGGEAHGEVASSMAVEKIAAHCTEAQKHSDLPLASEARPDLSPMTNRLVSAVQLANHAIYEKAKSNPSHKGMGATVVAVCVDGQRMSVANVGDSRVYLLRAGELQQLTEDHSLVAEQVRRGILSRQQAEESKMQSVLLRAMGIDPDIEIDADEHLLMDGDVVLLCSDGLDRMASDPEIASTILTHPGAQASADNLVQLALENGGQDNVTVILFRYELRSENLFTRVWNWLNAPLDSQSPAR